MRRRFVRPLPAALLVFALLGATASVAYVRRTRAYGGPVRTQAPVALPVVLPSDDPKVESPSPSPSPSRSPRPKPRPKPKPKPPARASLAAFHGLGTWVDVYDYALDPVESTRAMRAQGVRTLYIQTGRFNIPGDFKDSGAVARWLDAAHANGLKVVGWYLPGYGDLERDVRKTVAIARFRTLKGERFDALAVDIEDKCEIDSATHCKSAPAKPGMTAAQWNAAIATHAARVRALVGRTYPMAAIPPPPLGMALRAAHWKGFPWGSLDASYDVVMPMIYWSYRDCSENPDHCAYRYTRNNVLETRRLVGPGLPVHAIGGVGDATNAAEVREYVRACVDTRSLGGSLYDFQTTSTDMWAPLRRLNVL